ncbi:MAG: Argininosuccinate synthase [Alphaproteobacteria bacterium MarineAlpha6_Bin5]|nr:MAG: Argininosuccinate synthase [Alphaproteobacteria bacterium MarineAlpha6_Bin5]|tara:strand:- start:978 stop:2153 length:1176 start_codon:yes stop_codon:yes gene_type:complete
MIKKIVLAYSGGLDTSVILKWLQNTYNSEVITYTSNLGQEIDKKQIIKNAKSLGVKKIIIEDLQNTFVKDYVYPMIRANALYEGYYLLGTAIARPLIAKRQIEIAKKYSADAVAHGATGKGNDQVRFELGYYYFNKKIKVVSPWREWSFKSRSDLINYAKKNNIPIPKDKKGEAPFSVDDNLFHTSTEGKILEDLKKPAPEYIYQRTFSPEKATNKSQNCTLTFSKGNLVAINNKKNSPKDLLKKLNELGKKHAIGRVDLVENRFIGIKSRGVYETPGGTILLFAHRAIESITLNKDQQHLKDEITPKYSELIYNGYWFSKERKNLQNIIDSTQKKVEGTVKLKLYKGNIIILERFSKKSLYSKDIASFEGSKGVSSKNAEKFIKKKRYKY